MPAETVVAPEIAKLMYWRLATLSDALVCSMTRAVVPVVTVTVGPLVVRSVYEVEVVDWLVVTDAYPIAEMAGAAGAVAPVLYTHAVES